MSKSRVNIRKASGRLAPFSAKKLRSSLIKSGADDICADQIVKEISSIIVEGMTTKKIYRLAFKKMTKLSSCNAARYKLKQAILELGPSGFPFEKFVAELFKFKGYAISVGEVVKGHCVKHEIDIIATNEKEQFMIECKYHNRQDSISDVKTTLYIQARFLDVVSQWKMRPSKENHIYKGWVVTNTRFSVDAIKYAECVGLQLLAWNYPTNNGMKEWIDQSGMYPITCLLALTKEEKLQLLDQGVVLCLMIQNNHALLEGLGLSKSRVVHVLKECKELCENVKAYQ